RRVVMRDLERYSLEGLVALAATDRLIEAYHIHPGHLEVTWRGARILVPHAHARRFVLDLLREGQRRRSPEPPDDAVGGDSAPVSTSSLPTLQIDPPRLDDLLAYANLLDLIEDYELSASGRTVLLHLRSCSSLMSADDAVAFLS